MCKNKRKHSHSLSHLRPERFREPSMRDPNVSLQILHDVVGEGDLVRVGLAVRAVETGGHHELGQVTHDLGRGGHLEI